MGLTRAEWQILMHLRRREGMTQSELAGVLELKIPSVGRLVHKLIGKGWVEFRINANDRRNKRLYLSVDMEDLLAEVQLIADSVNESSLLGLSNPETEVLTNLLLRVKANLLEVRDEDVASVGMGTQGSTKDQTR